MKLTEENLKLFNKISFSECKKEDGIISGFLDAKTGYVFGNSKLEVLEKVINIQKQNEKREKSYFKLPTANDVIALIREGSKIKKEYLVRTQNDPNYWQFNFHTEILTKEELLKIIFKEDYFEYDKERTESYNSNRKRGETSYKLFIKRNNKEIDLIFWSRHKDIIDYFANLT